jgi:ELWxxDGT repeat protein
MVKDIYPGFGFASAAPTSLVNMNGTLCFSANDGTHGAELWRGDGTAAGTILVKDIFPGGGWSLLNNLTNVNGTLLFSADDSIHGHELWNSDGTTAGTTFVKDIYPAGFVNNGIYYVNSSDPRNLTNVSGWLFFSANDGIHGLELWKSDGTAAGTTLFKDIIPGSVSSSPGNLTIANGTLFFSAVGGLWQSDGTATGTVLVANLAPSSLTNRSPTACQSMSVSGLRKAGTAKVCERESAVKCGTRTSAAGESSVGLPQFFSTIWPCEPNATTMRPTPRAIVDQGIWASR